MSERIMNVKEWWVARAWVGKRLFQTGSVSKEKAIDDVRQQVGSQARIYVWQSIGGATVDIGKGANNE